MTFDIQKFEAAKPKPRTEEVRLPELAGFFDGDPVWVVRGLEGKGLAEANAAVDTNRALVELMKRLGGGAKAQAEAAMAALGISEKVPDDLVRRHAILRLGSIEPTLNQAQVVRFARHWPVEFYTLTNKILELTGQGPNIEGESSASGQTPGCEAPSHSVPEASEGEVDSGSSMR